MAFRAASIFTLLLSGFFVFFVPPPAAKAQNSLLSSQEQAWLQSRNNTIVVYPEKNDPPFSYQTASGMLSGLSIDYIDLIAEKVGANIQYLTPRSRSQILADAKEGKGDVLLSLTSTARGEEDFLFTESYVTVPVVIVMRKDASGRSSVTLGDFAGKRVAVVEGSAAEEYLHKNYPRVVIESVSDDEVGLQQVVLAEVDAALMDAVSLSYFLSKQVLNSVKIAGSTGFSYELSFAIPKEKQQLQAILEKGLSQISAAERSLLAEKWVLLPEEEGPNTLFHRIQTSAGVVFVYIVLTVLLVGILILLFRRRTFPFHRLKKRHELHELKDEMEELEDTSKLLAQELEEVKEQERRIAEKIDELKD